jgi:hypothetical protein
MGARHRWLLTVYPRYCALQSSFLTVSNAMPVSDGVRAMAKIEIKTDAATWALRAAAILGVMYGFGFLLMPDTLFQLSGDPGVPTNPGWVRWAGGFVLGISLGPWLASEGWVKEQQPFIAGFAAAFTLSGLALLYGVISGEYGGAAWFIWMPIILLAVLAAPLWWLATK